MNERWRPLVFLVDDDPDVLNVLTSQLELGGYEVRGFGSAEAFLNQLDPQNSEGCVVTDVNLPRMNGVALIAALAQRGSTMPVIVITGLADVPLAVRAMQAGAVDFLEKPIGGPAIRAAIEQALKGAAGQSGLRRERVLLQARLGTLSRRERDMFDGLVSGRLAKQVAHDLGISPRTAEIYRAKMMEKLGFTTGNDLQRAGIVLQLFGTDEER